MPSENKYFPLRTPKIIEHHNPSQPQHYPSLRNLPSIKKKFNLFILSLVHFSIAEIIPTSSHPFHSSTSPTLQKHMNTSREPPSPNNL